MQIAILPALPDHITEIAASVRQADRDEFWAFACMSPEAVMRQALRLSDYARTGFVDDIPVCMFGVAPGSFVPNVGRPWLVGTVHLEKYATVFLRRCRGEIEQMLALYPMLENHVDVRNELAIRWLIRMGFNMWIPPEKVGPFNKPFFRFEMRRGL